MTIQIKLNDSRSITVKAVSSKKLTALRSLHGKDNIKLVFDYNLQELNW